MDIETDALGIPDTEYKSIIKMPANEFQKICTNLSAWGESVVIATKKNDVKFSVNGDIGSGNITIKQSSSDDDTVWERRKKKEERRKKKEKIERIN